MINEFKDVFEDELGSLPGVVHLKVDPNASPHIAASRRVEVAMKPKLKRKFNELINLGVIVQVTEPTNWVNAFTYTVKKNQDIGICLDPRPLNKVLKREHYQLPVLDDVLPELSEAHVITTLDLRNGFWHLNWIKKAVVSQLFHLLLEGLRWTVLPFGLSSAPEIFQRHVSDNVSVIDGVLCVADDLLVYGKGSTKEEAVKDHDMKLRKLLLRCRERGMRLNISKLKLRQSRLSFLGHEVSCDGLHPDPEKVQAITDMPRPTDVQSVQRLGGFVNYL